MQRILYQALSFITHKFRFSGKNELGFSPFVLPPYLHNWNRRLCWELIPAYSFTLVFLIQAILWTGKLVCCWFLTYQVYSTIDVLLISLWGRKYHLWSSWMTFSLFSTFLPWPLPILNKYQIVLESSYNPRGLPTHWAMNKQGNDLETASLEQDYMDSFELQKILLSMLLLEKG